MHMAMHRDIAQTLDLDHLENQCPTCGNFFNSKDTLNMHMEDHRISYGNTYLNESLNMDTSDYFEEQTFSCRLCQSVFHSKERLRMHADEHKFTHKCNQCNIAFKSEKNLMKHKRMCKTKMNEINGNNWGELRKGMEMEEMARLVAKDMYLEARDMDWSRMRYRGTRGGQKKKAAIAKAAGIINVVNEAIGRNSGQ